MHYTLFSSGCPVPGTSLLGFFFKVNFNIFSTSSQTLFGDVLLSVMGITEVFKLRNLMDWGSKKFSLGKWVGMRLENWQ